MAQSNLRNSRTVQKDRDRGNIRHLPGLGLSKKKIEYKAKIVPDTSILLTISGRIAPL